MKKTILKTAILTTAIVAAIAILGLFKTAGKTGKFAFDNSQIWNVIQQEQKCRSEHFRNGIPRANHYSDYVKTIDRIDYSLCPSDFKVAWHDYVESREANLAHPVLNAFSSNTPVAKYRELEHVAMRYGFTFTAH